MRDTMSVRDRFARSSAGAVALAFIVAALAGAGAVVGATTADKPAAPATRSAKHSARKATRATHMPSTPTPARADMVVGIDPATGELVPPTAEQMQAIEDATDAALDRSTAGLEVITKADGSKHVDLEGRFRAYSVVTIGADGALHVACVDGRASALALASAGASSIDGPSAHAPRVVVGPREE